MVADTATKGCDGRAKAREWGRMGRLISLESKKAGGNVTSPGLAAAIVRAKALTCQRIRSNALWPKALRKILLRLNKSYMNFTDQAVQL